MNLYAESSAVLAWLIGEPAGRRSRRALAEAARVVTSSLTILECARAIARAKALGRVTATEELAALHLLDSAAWGWHLHDVTDAVLSRARNRLPVEPVRSLGAVHLATAAVFRDALGQVTLLSLDERIRANAPGLGLGLIRE